MNYMEPIMIQIQKFVIYYNLFRFNIELLIQATRLNHTHINRFTFYVVVFESIYSKKFDFISFIGKI